MKIFFDVIGCRLNQSEVEALANTFSALGHEIVPEPSMADLAIVNTCAVTVKAAADSRKQLRRAGREGASQVIATGCWATLYPDEALALPGVTRVVANDEKDALAANLLGLSEEDLSQLEMVREPLPGDRSRTRAFIKVQEGCDSHCTYCITRLARGRSRSQTLAEIDREIRAALKGGAREVVLTGVELGVWGRDLPNALGLVDLITHVLTYPELDRVRLSSIEPWDFDPGILPLWKDHRLCRHYHIPLQSGSDPVLKKMGRPLSGEGYRSLIHTIREAIPEAAITTDVITGFPGETEADFNNTLVLIREIGFAGGHVFTYSPRPGTAAYKMKEAVPNSVAKARNAALRKVFNETGKEYRTQFIGKTFPVLWESSDRGEDGSWQLSGLTDNYIRVYAAADHDLWNTISLTKLEKDWPQRNAMVGVIEAPSMDKE
jgi:threonylcarbamoyladenosine tRNA methylthiotransferase MtaB